jgi:hypothetical protein
MAELTHRTHPLNRDACLAHADLTSASAADAPALLQLNPLVD